MVMSSTSDDRSFEDNEAYPIFPIFLLVDTSGSMGPPTNPIEAVNQALPELKEMVREDPTVGEIARVGLITFDKGARSDLALCDLEDVEVPTLRAEGEETDFGAAFDVARREIEEDIRALGTGSSFYKPVIFFLSDGHYNAQGDWRPAHQQLIDPSWHYNPEIVAFGFGEANRDEIQNIATRYAFFAKDVNPARAAKEIMNTIIGSIRVTSGKLHAGDADAGLVVRADPEEFETLPMPVRRVP
jgi:uncharacterized protein YegL